MGEMADWLIEQTQDAYPEWCPYGSGRSSKPPTQCRVCGSTDVRWRQQGGKWVLFSLQPGVEHQCSAEDLTKDFD